MKDLFIDFNNTVYDSSCQIVNLAINERILAAYCKGLSYLVYTESGIYTLNKKFEIKNSASFELVHDQIGCRTYYDGKDLGIQLVLGSVLSLHCPQSKQFIDQFETIKNRFVEFDWENDHILINTHKKSTQRTSGYELNIVCVNVTKSIIVTFVSDFQKRDEIKYVSTTRNFSTVYCDPNKIVYSYASEYWVLYFREIHLTQLPGVEFRRTNVKSARKL